MELDDADIDELFLWNTLLNDCCPTVIQLVVFDSFYQGETHQVNDHDRGTLFKIHYLGGK